MGLNSAFSEQKVYSMPGSGAIDPWVKRQAIDTDTEISNHVAQLLYVFPEP